MVAGQTLTAEAGRPSDHAALRPRLNDRVYKEEHHMHCISTRGHTAQSRQSVASPKPRTTC